MKIERGGNPLTVTRDISLPDIGSVIRGLAGEPDVTVTISGSDLDDGEMMLAISNGKFFLGLVSPQGEVYQYTAKGEERLRGKVGFTIGGQPTGVQSRYVIDSGTAAAAVQEWLTGGREAMSSGHWNGS